MRFFEEEGDHKGEERVRATKETPLQLVERLQSDRMKAALDRSFFAIQLGGYEYGPDLRPHTPRDVHPEHGVIELPQGDKT